MKNFVRILFLLAALGILSPLGSTYAKTVKFTFGTTNGPKDFSSLAMVRWQSAMKVASKGELDMNFVPGGALGGDKQLLQQLSTISVWKPSLCTRTKPMDFASGAGR